MAQDSDAEDVDTLEVPNSASALYYAVGADVSRSRPLLTGDILSGVVIPGLEDGEGFAIVLTHPCGMRKDGVQLVEKLFMARVRSYQKVSLEKWASTSFKVMPLPELPGFDVDPAAMFNEAGLVRSDTVDLSSRQACLSESGINLLQQRLVYHLTRFAISTAKLHNASEQVFDEVELHEEWVTTATDAGVDSLIAQQEFHSWLRSADSEGEPTRQERLLDAQQAAAVRRELRATLREKYDLTK